MTETICDSDLSWDHEDVCRDMVMQTLIKPEFPGAEEFVQIRKDAGWGSMPITLAETTLRNSAACICAREHDSLIGLARAIGDHVACFYITDVFVSSDCRGQSLGQSLLHALVEELHTRAGPDAMIAVIPLAGLERFYERSGFVTTPNDTFGSGLVRTCQNTSEGVT